jgi:hypothetical protein
MTAGRHDDAVAAHLRRRHLLQRGEKHRRTGSLQFADDRRVDSGSTDATLRIARATPTRSSTSRGGVRPRKSRGRAGEQRRGAQRGSTSG